MSGAKPLVSIDGGGVHALSWSFVEKLDEKGGKESTSSEYNVGDRVLVRDAATDNWKKARIESVSPQVTAKVDGAARAFSWNQIAKDTTNQLAPGKRVRFRDSEREDWKRGVVDSMNAKGLPVVRGDGQTRAFTWNFVELDDEAPDPAVVKEAGYRVGDRLSVKDTANAPWRSGVVESIADGIPKIRVDGASMAFTWNYVAKNPANTAAVNFSVGDKVRVRDNPQDDWKSGVVKSAGPKPMVQVATGTFTWRFVEPDTSSRTPAIASSSSSSQFGRDPPAKEPTYKIGERVLVRDSDRDPWKRGAVVSAGGSKPTVKVDGSDRSFTWNSYKRDEGAPAPGSEVVEKFRAGETVLVRDTDKESWKEGVVESAFGSRPTVKLVGQSRAFTWGQVKKGPDTWVVGDRVRVRDHVSEDWKDGVVDDVSASVIKVKVGNQRAFSWNFIERRP
ncbi:hypothetical protein DIPPA_25404 [Diplonema papillatum]|nr:hypothetical protein DIPPA_25404 [Diplonema papillatum]KAJ9450269.1 hypothetical protein DIPPA_25404 [Diplonema papillatum]KAJ9450270.1 hypothetical protein DIPPA_25404 [Diplonema papillatum]